MAFPIVFIWFLIAIFIFRHHLRKNSKAQESVTKAFWTKEESSLVVRKKALNSEDYVQIHLTEYDLKDQAYYEKIGVPELYRRSLHLREVIQQPMVNFQHVTNTDLRLTYGTAMITVIEQCEDNYVAYVTTLYKMGKKLIEVGEADFGCFLLEEGINVGTDNRQHYLALATHYKEVGNTRALEGLLNRASSLESLTKDALLKELGEMLGR